MHRKRGIRSAAHNMPHLHHGCVCANDFGSNQTLSHVHTKVWTWSCRAQDLQPNQGVSHVFTQKGQLFTLVARKHNLLDSPKFSEILWPFLGVLNLELWWINGLFLKFCEYKLDLDRDIDSVLGVHWQDLDPLTWARMRWTSIRVNCTGKHELLQCITKLSWTITSHFCLPPFLMTWKSLKLRKVDNEALNQQKEPSYNK